MSWIDLQRLLLDGPAGPDCLVTRAPELGRAALCRQALAVAGGLQARGVRRIAVHLEDAAELAVTLLGAWRAGVAVLLPADLQTHSRQRLEGQAELWLSDRPGDLRVADLCGTPLAPAALDPAAPCLTLCTSGSSGAPKLIDKQLAQLANEVRGLEQQWGAELGGACMVGSVSTQHIYGLLFRALWPLCAGRPFLRRQLAFPEDLQQASLAEDSFAWAASPALLKRMADNLDWPALRRVRRVFSSGGPLPAEAGQWLAERLGQYPTEIYGSSETGGIAWRQGGRLWQPFAGTELGQDDQGALNIRSPLLPAGHCEQTADRVQLHEDGRFELLGRLDRIVKLEEKRISLPMLEQALAEHPWVAEARLGLIEDNRAYLGALLALSAEGLHALRNQGRRSLTETLRQHLAGYCEAVALPRRWRLVRRLPLNSQGKLPQAELQALLEGPRPLLPELLGQREDAGQWSLELEVPVDLAHFSGHFPQTPVLPGVVQVDWAQQLARQVLELPPLFAGMEVLKFQQLIRPGDRLQLTLRFDAERGKLHFAFRNGELACSSGRILLAGATDA
ncbi:acyl-CoA synthetase family protein [Geopseudomonas guangdongensis]|uniref:Acyl-coenzyme A synthetase/AMP-(Fatty) acid ligase n=1 Tax=Geopseudomonas guangdongensis TaxID=1245526 RepID=A0A1H2G7B8_9GAMM|nr:acyl-CoA synthetase family protein [Pseudomonas guangdongensis]SDU15371.1 Acyl-coenzyme A synthetase/AMP-(fatty) acid ligase [Pseudomonas guangdongensis]